MVLTTHATQDNLNDARTVFQSVLKRRIKSTFTTLVFNRYRKLPLSRKLLRLLSLVCGILILLFSVFLLSRYDMFHYFYGGSEMGRGVNYFEYYSYRLIVLILIGAVFILGIALIAASYYRHGETNLPMKI